MPVPTVSAPCCGDDDTGSSLAGQRLSLHLRLHLITKYVSDDVQISTRIWDGQLPTLIQFENGKEAARMPAAPRKNAPVQTTKMRKVRHTSRER